MSNDPAPRWRRYLNQDEAVEVAALDRAIEMHRELMAPLIDARRRVQRTANMRMFRERAGAQQSNAA